MGQTFDMEFPDPARTTVLQLLDVVPFTGGRAEGKRRDRAAEALELAKAGVVRLTTENVEEILRVIDASMTATKNRQTGEETPGILVGRGYRTISAVVPRLEAAAKGDVSQTAGVTTVTLATMDDPPNGGGKPALAQES